MASVRFKLLPPNATNAEICRYINNLVEELSYVLENIDGDNTAEEYVTSDKSRKQVAGAIRYAATECDEKLKAYEKKQGA